MCVCVCVCVYLRYYINLCVCMYVFMYTGLFFSSVGRDILCHFATHYDISGNVTTHTPIKPSFYLYDLITFLH